MNDHAWAHHLAGQARDLLVSLRRTDLGGEELGREGDRQAHALLVDALREQRPGDAVLTPAPLPVVLLEALSLARSS